MHFIYIPQNIDSSQDLIRKLDNLEYEFEEYKKFWLDKNMLNKKNFPKVSDNRLIEQAIPKNSKNLEKKIQNKEYYIANILMIDWLLKELFNKREVDEIKKQLNNDNNNSLISNYNSFFKNLSNDMIILEQNYQTNINGLKIDGIISEKKRSITVWKNPFIDIETIFRGSMQNIFGCNSNYSLTNLYPTNSIIYLRMGIELRIRKLFGTSAFSRISDSSLHPINISSILDFLKSEENDIEFPIPFANLIRINNWTNNYIHSGKKDYIWNPVFVYKYTYPIFCRECVKIKSSTLKKLHNELLERKGKEKYRLFGFTPEAIIT